MLLKNSTIEEECLGVGVYYAQNSTIREYRQRHPQFHVSLSFFPSISTCGYVELSTKKTDGCNNFLLGPHIDVRDGILTQRKKNQEFLVKNRGKRDENIHDNRT